MLELHFDPLHTGVGRLQNTGKGVSILEVAERCQDAKASGANVRPSSPRTVEAFLRSGFDPDDLVYKPISYFKARTQDDELAQLAFTFFEEGRVKRIEELRMARQALIDDGWKPGDIAAAPCAAGGGGKGDANTADMVERERKRLEVLRTRCNSTLPCTPQLLLAMQLKLGMGRRARVITLALSL